MTDGPEGSPYEEKGPATDGETGPKEQSGLVGRAGREIYQEKSVNLQQVLKGNSSPQN